VDIGYPQAMMSHEYWYFYRRIMLRDYLKEVLMLIN